ncbi:hypothetical protein I4U23_028469 [Adineta vaga]|nr:hypothetical protein I4U23_028469 [Adineta vaga]
MPDINELHNLYSSDQNGLLNTINSLYDRIEKENMNLIWISIISRENVMKRVKQLLTIPTEDRSKFRLYGIPFAVKDNVNVVNLPTTAGCPAFACETATENAPVVEKLEQAGGILIGKTNMDQFATGLVGTRTPYGACASVFNENYISGGSSLGSAVVVASGLVTFALGTDTAGSGRVPAMFNNVIGLKPTRGLLSTRGVIPACRSLDCIFVFAETASDAAIIFSVTCDFDELDPYSCQMSSSLGATPWISSSTFRFGIPTIKTREFFGDMENPKLFQNIIDTIQRDLNGQAIEFDFTPFLNVAALLYKGPWVAERYAAVGQFIDEHEAHTDPTVYKIISNAKKYTAVDAFNGLYELERLKKQVDKLWKNFDVMLVPTAPRAYTIDEINGTPIEYNSHLGYYTNSVNLLDLAAIAIPAGIRSDGLPFGVTLISHAFTDNALLLRRSSISSNCFHIAVIRAHLSGQPLNYQLTERNGRLIRTCRTHHEYRLYALENTTPAKPGLIRKIGSQGPGIELEISALPNEHVASFIHLISSPLSIGNIYLEDEQIVKGFLVESSALDTAQDITDLGGWRSYLETINTSK